MSNSKEVTTDKIKNMWSSIIDMLPNEPRSYDVMDDPGFWTNGDSILCPSETEMNFVYEFLNDLFSRFGECTIVTGYYDPFEDAKSGESDECTGFYYVSIE